MGCGWVEACGIAFSYTDGSNGAIPDKLKTMRFGVSHVGLPKHRTWQLACALTLKRLVGIMGCEMGCSVMGVCVVVG